MEYLVVLLVLAIIAIYFFKKPNKVKETIVDALVESLRKNEPYIVQGIYNKLPASIKNKVDSKLIAEIVESTIGVVIDLLTGKDEGNEKK